MTSPSWTTRLPPELTRQFGVEELHDVWFAPKGSPGKGNVVCLLIPECELQVTVVAPDGKLVQYVNRPPNRNLKTWLHFACEEATTHRAALSLGCDTAEQAERYAEQAARLLPHHERVALERLYDPASRSRAALC